MNSPLAFEEANEFKLSVEDFEFIRKSILSRAGIKLDDTKMSFVRTRLNKRLLFLKFKTFKEYLEYLNRTESEWDAFINSLTTNKSEFFREQFHFDFLVKEILPHFKTKTIYCWSAACSRGHEPYSLSMEFADYKQLHNRFNYKILATDIDTSVLSYAMTGEYDQLTINQQIRSDRIQKYLTKRHENYLVKDEVKQAIKFRQYNLCQTKDSIPMKFDVIFVRNVLIYFEKPMIDAIIRKMTDHLAPNGYLILGHCESLMVVPPNLKSCGHSIYQKR